ncbi:MAG: T9SS type A sorting domain-containing protein [Flavobacteriales bacterium]|nr:T9SS type A sorting domain-containing protein [Flavobacteriales bacterium]
MNSRSFLAPLVLLAALPGMAQWDLYFDGTVPVQRQGIPLDLAWAGGLNTVQMGQVDLNGDGLKDLFLFDRIGSQGNKVITLINTGGTNNLGYRVTRDYDHVYPLDGLHDWALMRDYNCDGKEDIFTYSQAGFSVFKNTTTGGDLSFQNSTYRVNSTYVSPSGTGSVANLFVSQVDLPGIADIDGDGDLDVLTFSLLGSYLEYHKNLSMELYGTCDSLKYELRNKCWGYFAENFGDNSVTLNLPCGFNVPAPEMETNGQTDPDNDRAHAGSTVTPINLDGDADKDLLVGDISFNNLVALTNGGTITSAIMVDQDTLFPSYDEFVDLPIFPAPSHVDVDKDGNRDLVVSPNGLSLVQNYESMWYYHNNGPDEAPIFDLQQRDLFQDRMIELGEGAYPVLFDENGDGLMDLVVSNHGYYETSGTYTGKIALLRNTGTATAPAFEVITYDYAGLSTSGIGRSMYPAFGDIDGDGDNDMYIGDEQGRLHFFRNISTGPIAQFILQQVNVPDMDGAMIDVGQFAAPQFSDLDGDGLLDLIIGERNGNLNHYRNVGSPTVASWMLTSEALGGVSTVEWWNVTGHSTPCLFRNAQNERELLLGSESGWLYHYGNIEGNVGGTWTLLDSTFMDLRDGSRTAPCLYDFTGDGGLDLVVGNYRGGLSFWRSDPISTVVSTPTPTATYSVVPNPASEAVDLLLDRSTVANSEWVLRNALGQVVLRTPARGQRTRVDLTGIEEGLYLVRCEGDVESSAQRLIVVK